MRIIIEESLKLSEQQLLHVKQSEWDAFHAMEPKRQQLIRSLSNVDVDVGSPDEIRSDLETLISINDEIEKRCIEQRNELMKLLVDIRAGAKASKAYQK
ncbi:MAG: flagellar protein FliT [Methylophaga sp.]